MKRICLLTILMLFMFIPTISANSDFTNALNEKLQEEVSYYDNGSVQLIEALEKEVEVTKVIKNDDPNTEEDESEIESYSTNVIVGFVEYKLKRDSIFYLKKSDIYFYDLDNHEFLLLRDIQNDTAIQSFYDQYSKDLDSSITIGTTLLNILFILSAIILGPILIILFHNKSYPLPMVRKNSVY